jgi:drug/metabolite transporter (DMT)-like permease
VILLGCPKGAHQSAKLAASPIGAPRTPWSCLLARHPAATVAPTALLVPVFGMTASALILGEGMPAWKLGAAALVLAGLGLNRLGSRRG